MSATQAKTATKYARVCVGTPGLVTRYIECGDGIGPVTFQQMCDRPRWWFTDVEGRRIRAAAIVTFQFVSELPEDLH